MFKRKWIKMGWVFLALLGTALACGLPVQPVKTPTQALVQVTATETEPAVIELVASATATALPPTDVPTDTPTPDKEPWRIAAMPGAIRLGTDQSPELDPKWAAIVDSAARSLSITQPYFFEIYDLRDGIRFADVRSYYDKQITQAGLNKIQDDMGGNGNGTVVWVDPQSKMHRFALKYYSATPTLQARMFIIYANPK